MITSVLVANRGEIARRIFRTARSLGLSTVAVHSTADAAMPFVGDADAAVHLPGNAPSDTYLQGELVIEAALRARADAVHPGYGFLSENAGFAQAVIDAGLTWIGPPVDAISSMGSKIEAKKLMAAAGVPVLAELTPAEVSAADLPVLVKASAGGGGRGMRVVSRLEDLPGEIEAASAEALSAFGDGTVFCERYLEAGRHIEVQIMADQHGTIWAVGERECSIQRRHQKVVEEAPSPLVERIPSMRASLFDAARKAAAAIGYVGAGTVEFLADSAGDFYFLEMNTRLQVEHPVTEETTGLDLVELQFAIAAGDRLPADPPPTVGHAIEVRLYAEDPAHDWQPQTGRLHRFAVVSGTKTAPGACCRIPQRPSLVGTDRGTYAESAGRVERERRIGEKSRGVLVWTERPRSILQQAPGDRNVPESGWLGPRLRVDSGVVDGSEVSPYYDAMLAKVIASGSDRTTVARRLAGELERARIHGVGTNRGLLVWILRHPAFLAGDTDTGFFERHGISPAIDAEVVKVSALAAALADAAGRARGVPSGWRNLPSQPQRKSYRVGDTTHEVAYRLTRDGLVADGNVKLLSSTPDQVLLEVDGVRRSFDVAAYDGLVCVDSSLGSVALTPVERFTDPSHQVSAGSLLAPMPGVVTRVGVQVGDEVKQGQPLLWLEAMKMEHTISAPADGVVAELCVAAGQQVEVGAVLAVVGEDA
ncbi:propionyl-CoA carboxylase alpha chain [Kribbella antiqua]|uniref:Propionyl-CoA carboxylase alpha chain n=1 Tax=Kribbella antiqua TaxID=2512217 RepID=A0A4R2IND9_9ACTN|nr:biotin carboxylase N-terminal domain-containing protein [Kribbella antiqua]TCO46082.1 propionyl-CoA carboxylase alpha chain [Kribbella antiqua]